jgi:isocitrate dehydrogenase (NAD+)
MSAEAVNRAKEHFGKLIEEQLARVEKMKTAPDWTDYSKVKTIKIGIAGGDGIGPIICDQTRRVVEYLLKDEVKQGKVEFVNIEGLTIENRYKQMKAVPEDVLEQIKKCHVFLKGPTETPKSGDPRGELESANVSLRRSLDLFANVRPVKVPEMNIDWTFFRENTEGEYVLGSKGINVTEDLAVDFKVTTTQGSERIIRAAFEYAKKKGVNTVTVVTKANVVKTTDGKFSAIAQKMQKEYPGIKADEWYIDIMAAKLIDPARRSDFKVFVLPNLYGDIITDEAAQIQGGVGTAGSANLGRQYAMFEAIHGSGTRMVEEGRAQYADPCSMIKAAVLMMEYIGFPKRAKTLDMALDICTAEKKLVCTGHESGATAEQFTDFLVETMKDPELDARWKALSKA